MTWLPAPDHPSALLCSAPDLSALHQIFALLCTRLPCLLFSALHQTIAACCLHQITPLLCSALIYSTLHQTFALPSPDHPLFYSAPDQCTAPDHLSALPCSSLQQTRALHQIFGLPCLHQITPLHNSAPDLLRLSFILFQTFALNYTEFHFALHCTRSLLCCSCTRSPPAPLCTSTC